MNWYDILDTVGVAVIILANVLFQAERLRSEQLADSLFYAVGATLILVSLYYSFDFPFVIVEFF